MLACALGSLATAGGALVLGGVLHPRLSLFGPVITRGEPDHPSVALTFDDGPHPRYTPLLARILDAAQVRATFFCVGAAVERHPSLAAELSARGHELENHTHRHDPFLDVFSVQRMAADLQRCQEVVTRATGRAPRFYRPAAGVKSPPVHRAARRLGLSLVTWSRSARDGALPFSVTRAVRLAARTRSGDILTLHDGTLSNRESLRSQTVAQLPRLIDELRHRGFELVTLSTLLG